VCLPHPELADVSVVEEEFLGIAPTRMGS